MPETRNAMVLSSASAPESDVIDSVLAPPSSTAAGAAESASSGTVAAAAFEPGLA